MSYNEYHKTYKKNRRLKRMAVFIAEFGGKCAQCPSTTDLEFDHIDPKSKKFEIVEVAGWMSEARIREELQKCQLLCSSCHSKKTIIDLGKQDTEGRHGTLSTYRNCRCEVCKQAKKQANVLYKEQRKQKGYKKVNGKWIAPS